MRFFLTTILCSTVFLLMAYSGPETVKTDCLDLVDGPDAPDLSFIALDQKVIGILSNEEMSNNANENYSELDPFSPESLTFEERLYQFEGYIVYQLVDADVTQEDLNNPSMARLVFQSDRQNEAVDIFNWIPKENPNAGPLDPPFVFIPELQVEGANAGLTTSFELTEDLFSGARLENQTTYYYMTLAYGYNEYEPFDPLTTVGQATSYIASTRNVQVYSVIPGANPDVMASFGDNAVVTRLDGQGAGRNFLSISDEERNRILSNQEGLSGYLGTIVYEKGAGPIDVKTVDPIQVREGNYVLRFDQDTNLVIGTTAWELFDAETNESLGRANQNLQRQDERFFPDLGFSVMIGQTPDAGDQADDSNGAIGQTISYANPANSWLTPVLDNASTPEVLQFYDTNYLPTDGDEVNFEFDPRQGFTNLGTGHFSPFTLMDFSNRPNFYATPGWLNPTSEIVQVFTGLQDLNNVDIVYTSDKSKWSRCVVVETGNQYFINAGFELDDGKENFDVVARPSVSREDNDGDGRPDPDNSGTTGFAWFPGYAIDVETGTRLNIFFGENSAFGDNTVAPAILDAVNGSDMMFNPSAQAALAPDPNPNVDPTAFNLILGGMHYVYVTRQPYDECALISEALRETFSFRRIPAFEFITWASIGLGSSDVPLLSYADGLIPTETVVKVRADNPYATTLGIDDNDSFPSYEFSIENVLPTSTTTGNPNTKQLDRITVYPNPSVVSTAGSNGLSTVVKIANLPSNSLVTMYTVDGLIVRQFQLDDDLQLSQDATLDWDLSNSTGTPIASGIYFIHVDAKGVGQRVLKLSVVK